MKILFIAPLPMPITGQSVASEALYENWRNNHEVRLINLSKNSFKQGISSVSRVYEILKILLKVGAHVRCADVIYFTISESSFGMLKDFLIYILCILKIKKVIIHLHGGAGLRVIREKDGLLNKIDKFFARRVGGVVLLGESHRSLYSGVVLPSKIYMVPNYADEGLFVTHQEILEKFESASSKLNVLFLSNLIDGKGHLELLSAFLNLDESVKSRISLSFAGGFDSKDSEAVFMKKIEGVNVEYHGVVRGSQKEALFKSTHVFCLPTYYAHEGQPISILEAYASGCYVITTNHSGIFDIFEDNVNGKCVEKRSVVDLQKKLEYLVLNHEELYKIAENNFNYAVNNFKKDRYIDGVNIALNSLN